MGSEREAKADVILLTKGKIADGWRWKASPLRPTTNRGERGTS